VVAHVHHPSWPVHPTLSPPQPRNDHAVTMSALLQRLLAPPVQVLRTLQPTSSTVSYTISTCSASNTIPAKIAVYTGLLIRILAGLSTALLLWIVARPSNSQIHDVLPYILGSHKTWQLFAFADTCQWTYLVPSAVVVFFLVFRRNYTGTSSPSTISRRSVLTITQRSP
jgi:phosphatidylinositol glycan class H protein